MRRAFVYVAGEGFAARGTWMDLPGPRPADVTGPYTLERHTFVKMFSERLGDGTASVLHPARDGRAGDRLVVSFDTTALPHLGFLACQGYDSLGDGHFAKEFLLALEPTTGIGDDLATCAAQGTLPVLRPGEERRFWIRWAVEKA